jgi:DNA-binding GntR family transcriptional regulator
MVKEKSLKQKAYNIIKSKIINCEYQPNSFLNEGILMDEIGASRTPIREALNKLEQENLVTIIPKKGVVVSELSIHEINMVFQVRDMIEPNIILLSCNKMEARVLQEFRDLITKDIKQDTDKFYSVDNDLHRYIVASSGNKYLIQTMDHIYNQIHRIRVLSGMLSGEKLTDRLKEVENEHIEIIDMLMANKAEEAARAMQNHLKNTRDAAIGSLLTNLTI